MHGGCEYSGRSENILRFQKEGLSMRAAAVLLIMFGMMQCAFGALSPSFYQSLKRKSPEIVHVHVARVAQYHYAHGRLHIKARAKVLDVIRTRSHLRRGQWITIRYITRAHLPVGMLGAAPIPILKRNHTYRVYIKRERRSRYYSLAAGSESFALLR
jgi:hypothetical protein